VAFFSPLAATAAWIAAPSAALPAGAACAERVDARSAFAPGAAQAGRAHAAETASMKIGFKFIVRYSVSD
jgi:hypothetical protein